VEDLEKARQMMYRQKPRRTKKVVDEASLSAGIDTILVEIQGKKVQVPSMRAFQQLKEENRQLRSNLAILEGRINKILASAKLIDYDLKVVENELRNKADKYE
jgi:vacuolar-type H+-ATPase subunit I/STV1